MRLKCGEPPRITRLTSEFHREHAVPVTMPFCYMCKLVSSGNSYETLLSMTTVAAGLENRTRF